MDRERNLIQFFFHKPLLLTSCKIPTPQQNARQRLVINAVVDKAASFTGFSKYQSILDAISKNVTINIPFDEMKNIALNYRDARQHVVTYEVQGTGKIIDKLWYLVVDDKEKQKVHQMVQDQLTDSGV